jgi:hypothetical protein
VGQATGVSDAAKALQGQMTPEEAQTFALGAAPMLLGGPEAGAAEEAATEIAPRFYSAVGNAVDSAKTNAAPAQQWLGMIRNTPGVKPEEMQWLGLEDWLKDQQGVVPKQAIADYIKGNQVGVQEVQHADRQQGLAQIAQARWRELNALREQNAYSGVQDDPRRRQQGGVRTCGSQSNSAFRKGVFWTTGRLAATASSPHTWPARCENR